MDLQERYLITGATSDIGFYLIRALMEEKHEKPFIIAQGFRDLEKLQTLCDKYPERIICFDVDLSDRKQVSVFIEELEKKQSILTHFVHLPALPVINTRFKAFDLERFEKDMEIQVYSSLQICKKIMPSMAKQKYGRVLFIQSSYTIGCPPKNVTSYVMAKSSIAGMVKCLAIEYARFGITVNCIAPSMMETHFLKDTPDLIVESSSASNPMGRNATPQDVVPAMQFLLSESARFITGVTLPITGGSVIL